MTNRDEWDIARLRPWAKWAAGRGLWWVVGIAQIAVIPVAAVVGAWVGACDTTRDAWRTNKKEVARLRELAPAIQKAMKETGHE